MYPDMSTMSFQNAVSFLLNDLFSDNKKASSVQLWGKSEGEYQVILPSNNDNFVDHLKDLLEFGLQDHHQNYGNFDGNFKLFHSYRRDQFLLMINQMQYTFQQGIFHHNSEVYFFIDLIKKSGIEEHLKYNDRFIDSNTILWESQTETTLTNNKGKKLLSYRQAHIFVRKSATIDGLLQPYIYLGKGHFHDPYATNNPKLTISVQIELETELPKYLQTELMDLEAKYEEDH